MSQIPDFFIVGAAKSGTTSLYNYLNQHPDIYFSPIKEPNFFSTDIKVEDFGPHYTKLNHHDEEAYFANTVLPELQLSHVRNRVNYLRLFEAAKAGNLKGDASTSYLYSSEAAKNIHDFNPGARIIAILRNPIDRALSHYLMALRFGYVTGGFRKAIENDLKAEPKGWGISELFIELGLYYEQLNRYYEVFPEDQILSIIYDDFVNTPLKTLKEILVFLGIPDFSFEVSDKHNAALVPKLKLLNKILYQIKLVGKLKAILPEKGINFLKSKFFSKDKPVLSTEDKNFLLDIYRNDIEKTAQLIQKDLSNWINN